MLAIAVSVRRENFGNFVLSRFHGHRQVNTQQIVPAKKGECYVIKHFLLGNPWFFPGFRIFPDFFRPKPGQFHVDSGNLNFIEICWELAEEIANRHTYRHTQRRNLYINKAGFHFDLKFTIYKFPLFCKTNFPILQYKNFMAYFCKQIVYQKWIQFSSFKKFYLYVFHFLISKLFNK